MNTVREQNGSLLWRRDGETVLISPWGQSSVRVRACVQHEPADDRWALLEPTPCQADIIISENEATLTCGNLRVVLTEDGWAQQARLSFYNQKGELLLQELAAGGPLALKARRYEPLAGDENRLTVTFEAQDGEHFSGMGQYQQDRMDLKGLSLDLFHRNSQASVPFVVSSLGYGFLWHCPAVGQAHFSENRTIWQAEMAKQVDYWITAGDTPAEILRAYAGATGAAPMMPEYGLGFWQCKLRYWNQEQLLEVAREFKRRKLPLDVIVCDFFHWPHLGDFRFDPEFWPDPAAMARELDAMGVKLMVSVWPQIGLKSENYDEMNREGLLMKCEHGVGINYTWTEKSIFYDATNPRAQAYVWDKCKQNYFDKGVGLFWLDEAEPELAGYDYANCRYFLGNGLAVTNLYPQQYAKTFYDGMVKSGMDAPVNLLRCAWAGSPRYGALVWSGDIPSTWQSFRNQICAGLHMGMAGIPWWTTDIGGFSGADYRDPAFRELLMRWLQWAAFCPVMRLHGDREPHENLYKQDGTPALFTGGDNEPWSFGEENTPIIERYIRLREAMRDYTRQLMREAHESGAPVIRPLFYQFPQLENAHAITDEYMYGPDVLVAPVTHPGASTRRVLLPHGVRWTELSTGVEYEGGQTIEVACPIEHIPVFLRDGKHTEWKKVLDAE